MQHPTGIAYGLEQTLEMIEAARVEISAQIEIRKRPGGVGQFGVDNAEGIAGGARAGLKLVDQGYPHTFLRESPGGVAASHAGADYSNFSYCLFRRFHQMPAGIEFAVSGISRWRGGKNPAQHFPLAAKARHFFHRKAHGGEAAADDSGGGECGEGGVGVAQFSDELKQFLGPQIRIFCRRKTIQKPGIDAFCCGEFAKAAGATADFRAGFFNCE